MIQIIYLIEATQHSNYQEGQVLSKNKHCCTRWLRRGSGANTICSEYMMLIG